MTVTLRRTVLRLFLAGNLLTLLIAGEGFAQSIDSNAPRPIAQAIELLAVPVIDGNVIDDPAWRAGEPITGFWQTQPNAGQAASQRTEVYIGFTDTALDIGVIAYVDEPMEIISTDSRRDS